MLGRYLATAPDDGAAWLELGRFYLLDSRELAPRGHTGDPPGALFLDFAAAALDQALRLPTDSARLLRAVVEVERLALEVEHGGLGALTRAAVRCRGAARRPAFVLEAGTEPRRAHAPSGACWSPAPTSRRSASGIVVFGAPERGDLVLLLPRPVRRRIRSTAGAWREALEVAPGLSVERRAHRDGRGAVRSA